MRKTIIPTLTLAAASILATSASALIIDGIDFPQGALSFADSVVSYTPAIQGGSVPSLTYDDPADALGIPDWASGPETGAVSLGKGGILILKFVDNFLTGSDDNGDDLWIFEVGSAVEDTFVDISKDGSLWYSVGKVFGATSGIDIDDYGFGSSDQFSYVRLTDDPNEGPHSYEYAGADIDAVGAISTVRNPDAVPDSTTTLSGLAIAMIGLFAMRRRLL